MANVKEALKKFGKIAYKASPLNAINNAAEATGVAYEKRNMKNKWINNYLSKQYPGGYSASEAHADEGNFAYKKHKKTGKMINKIGELLGGGSDANKDAYARKKTKINKLREKIKEINN